MSGRKVERGSRLTPLLRGGGSRLTPLLRGGGSRLTPLLQVGLVVVVAVVAVLPSLSGELVWDDVFWARQIQYFTSLAAVLRPPADIPDWPAGYFRPVTTLSYLLDLALHGPQGVAGRHASNIAFHATSSALLWLLARRLLGAGPGRDAGALVAALLFAAHPIHTESVCWIGARVDVLATLFTLACALLALAWRDRGSVVALLLAPVAFLLAAGSKEVGVAALGLVPLVLLLAPRPAAGPPPRHAAVTWIPLAALLAAAAALYVTLRLAGSQSVAGQLDAPDPVNLLRAAGYYLVKLAWPWPQANFVVWDMVPGIAASLAVVAIAFALLGLAAWWWRRSGDGAPLAGLLWTGMALAPSLVVALSSFAATPVAERYLYLPSAGFALACGALAGRLSATRWRWPALGVAAAVCAAFLAGSILRSFDWSSNVRLWSSTTRTVATHGQPWVELGLAHYSTGDHEAALASFREALAREIDPGTRAVAEYHAGVIHLKRRDLAAAEQAFRRARASQPDYVLASYGLGRAWYERALEPGPSAGRLELATRSADAFRESIRLSPGFGEPRRELARVLLLRGDLQAEAGRSAAAEESYRSGLAQLETLIRALPALAADPGIAELRAELREKAGS